MTLDFDLVDVHQHFWDPFANYHPWLCDEAPIAFRYGDYTALRRPYLPPDYLAEARPYRRHTAYLPAITTWIPRLALGGS